MSNPRDFHAPQSSYTKEDLLKSSEGGYFGPGNAQLPAPPMLMIDRITEISLDGGEFGKGHVIAELDITPGLWFFDCHFRGDPVMPGCLGLDAMWQIVGYWLGWSGSPGKGRAVGVGEVKFRGDIKPDIKRVRYEVSMRQVRRGKLAVGIAERQRVCRRRMRISRQGYEGRNDSVRDLRCGSLPRAVLRQHGSAANEQRRSSWTVARHAPHRRAPSENKRAYRSGTNPDDRNRNRDTQTKCAENRRDEFGKQTCLVSYAR